MLLDSRRRDDPRQSLRDETVEAVSGDEHPKTGRWRIGGAEVAVKQRGRANAERSAGEESAARECGVHDQILSVGGSARSGLPDESGGRGELGGQQDEGAVRIHGGELTKVGWCEARGLPGGGNLGEVEKEDVGASGGRHKFCGKGNFKEESE